jgi:hypothetical protein
VIAEEHKDVVLYSIGYNIASGYTLQDVFLSMLVTRYLNTAIPRFMWHYKHVRELVE